MYDIQHLDPREPSALENEIFDACRANPKRENRGRVSFRVLVTGGHEASLRDAEGVVVVIAKVDEFDV